MRSPQQWNTPLKSLLKDLQSEDRKTENAALKELRRRFVGLDKEQQMQVIIHYLHHESHIVNWHTHDYLICGMSLLNLSSKVYGSNTMRKNVLGLSLGIFPFRMYRNTKRT